MTVIVLGRNCVFFNFYFKSTFAEAVHRAKIRAVIDNRTTKD